MPIELLPEDLINKIAAGEVIENPGAVIKELIENSLDAGANEIEIDLQDSGTTSLLIKDNGTGIVQSELAKAPLRHSTSKIKSLDDLYSIQTMGFRGEALASIFSVSKAKLSSKAKGAKEAYEISSDNFTPKQSGVSFGTVLLIENLFYNTPARKKYLKSQTMELKSVLDILNRYEVYFYDKKFTLKNNGKVLVNKPIFKNLEQNLYYVLGRDLKDNLFHFTKEERGIKVEGFIGKPSAISYSTKKNQYFYVNARYIKSKLLTDAIYDGFGSNLMVGRHPFFVIYITIDPEIIDVNIHPTKIEVKFENELEIYKLVRDVVEEVFETQESFKAFEEEDKEENKSLTQDIDSIASQVKRTTTSSNKTYFSKEFQHPLQVNEGKQEYSKPQELEKIVIEQKKKGPLYDALKEYRILGQINKTFIVLETPKEMILVDQHVAEEKFYFEEFKKQAENKSAKTQMLLKTQVIHLTSSEMLMYKENKEILERVGFESEEFGTNEIIVRAVPLTLRREIMQVDNLKEMLYDVLINKKIKCVEEEKHSKLASMACRTAIMAGDELTQVQMRRIIENLRHLKQPFNCPHGRPTFLKYTHKELEKKFKRIV